jgi:CRISPR-associated protein Csb2
MNTEDSEKLIIELQLPAGRYHATQWGRNVNEGDPEWPPSPYRLSRALIDVWKRRKPSWTEERVLPILQALSGPVLFHLPPAIVAHTRSYLSSNEKIPSRKQLVFDAFVVTEHDSKVLMGFELGLKLSSIRDLEELVEELNYLGRSESWVRAKLVIGGSKIKWNCVPRNGHSVEQGESMLVACTLPPQEYTKLRFKPEGYTWLEALCFTTEDLHREGWSNPPALSWFDYIHFKERVPVLRKAPLHLKERFRFAKYALSSTVLPSVQETVPFAERIRAHLMGIHKRIQNDDPTLVSPTFSGKGQNGEPLKGHQHAFHLPVDEDGDGRLDHLLIASTNPFNNSELMALDKLRSVWQPRGRPDVRLILVSLSGKPPEQRSVKWMSVTPFVTSRHYRKGRGPYEEWLLNELNKECAFHKLPSPSSVDWIPHTLHTLRPIHWWEFTRKRKNMPLPHAYGCIITFDEPVEGPVALGSGCHFGLGLFTPCNT